MYTSNTGFLLLATVYVVIFYVVFEIVYTCEIVPV